MPQLFPGFEQRVIDTDQCPIAARIGGSGPPLLLLHGYPESHVMWHKVAPRLAERFTVVATDLRGYGDSGKPASDADHRAYSKRLMAADQVAVMEQLGHERFQVVGHDRGARVTHRMCLDWPDRVRRAAVLDIVPTSHVFETADQRIARRYYHWFFLSQPAPLPERLISNEPEFYLDAKLKSWGQGTAWLPAEVRSEYLRCFSEPETIRATCEDYRAGATIDLTDHATDRELRIRCPLLVLWGARAVVHELYDALSVWREWADDVAGEPIDCGHYLPEEAPDETLRALSGFLSESSD